MYHIEYAPEQPEPYYKATGKEFKFAPLPRDALIKVNLNFAGKELQPRPVGEEHGIIVYNYMPISAVHYVSLCALHV